MWVVCLGHLKNFSRECHGGPPGTAERLHGIWGSLGMGQGRCIGGSGPHNFQPAAKGGATWERWWMPRVGAHGDSTRQWSKKVKLDPRKSAEVLWTSRTGIATFYYLALSQKLNLFSLEVRQPSRGHSWVSSLGSRHLAGMGQRTAQTTHGTDSGSNT